jgi:hypothetical protein
MASAAALDGQLKAIYAQLECVPRPRPPHPKGVPALSNRSHQRQTVLWSRFFLGMDGFMDFLSASSLLPSPQKGDARSATFGGKTKARPRHRVRRACARSEREHLRCCAPSLSIPKNQKKTKRNQKPVPSFNSHQTPPPTHHPSHTLFQGWLQGDGQAGRGPGHGGGLYTFANPADLWLESAWFLNNHP